MGVGTHGASGGAKLSLVARRRGNLSAGCSSSEMQWTCIEGCGACCQLDKGPLAPPIETILRDVKELEVSVLLIGIEIEGHTAHRLPPKPFYEFADGR